MNQFQNSILSLRGAWRRGNLALKLDRHDPGRGLAMTFETGSIDNWEQCL